MDVVESFQKQALEVRDFGEDFDPDFEPQNGEEFLMKVIYERKQCPAVIVKPLKDQQTVSITSVVPENSEMDSVSDASPTSLRPTVQWKDAQAEDFIKIMEKIEKMREKTELLRSPDDSNIPTNDDEIEWEAFCRKSTPLLSTVLRINQRLMEKLLEFQADWLRDEELEDVMVDLCGKHLWLGSWIYSCLACLRMPLEPDVHSVLRDIARSCIRQRSKLTPDDVDRAVPYNLFILIICKVFDQLDLAEFI